jgi:hypothetical protein
MKAHTDPFDDGVVLDDQLHQHSLSLHGGLDFSRETCVHTKQKLMEMFYMGRFARF